MIRSCAVLLLYRCNAPVRKTREIPSAKIQKPKYLIELRNSEWINARGDAAVDLRQPMLELHGLLEFIRPFRLRKQLCLTRSRWVFESYAWAVRVLRSNIGAYQFARLQGINVIHIFLFALCDRAPVLLIRSSARNQCDPGFLFLSLNQTGPYYALCLRTNIGCLVIIEKHNSIQPFFPLQNGENLYDTATIFGSDSGWN